ncbi:MAG: bifunctional riboflavin kinase/FAD synthetase [Myxococcales bacterium]|nr:bifunctional riboflavin kinase/FAD synthetase [Myxococcales bacterium]
MEVVDGYRALPRPLVRPAIAIGNFDGVHVGHAALIAAARDATAGGDACALTFEPHPAQVLAPAAAPPRITTPARKLELLAAAGVDVAIVVPFTAALAQLTATAFVDEVLAGALGARHVVVGADFVFGRGRGGSVATLTADGARHGVATRVVDPVLIGDRPASSTRVRAALAAGDLAAAGALLGHGYDLDGVVVRGAGRGKGLGVPTANVATDGAIVAQPGIYAVTLTRLERDARPLPAVASLGTNPTFVDGGGLVLEVHVLDFDADLYGERVRVDFVARLRAEARYDSVAALLAQIDQDIVDARAVLARR